MRYYLQPVYYSFIWFGETDRSELTRGRFLDIKKYSDLDLY